MKRECICIKSFNYTTYQNKLIKFIKGQKYEYHKSSPVYYYVDGYNFRTTDFENHFIDVLVNRQENIIKLIGR